jgi:SMODS and SLOG-associating 2TM effector domain 2
LTLIFGEGVIAGALKMGKNIAPIPFPNEPGHDDNAKAKYIHDIYQYAGQKADEAISWYLSKKTGKQRMAQILRFAAIVLTTVGGLIPLVIASHVLPAPGNAAPAIEYGQFGYIALALAGACVFLDKFFGFSSGWMRYITTAMKLQRMREEFNVDWAILQSATHSAVPDATEREAMLKCAQTFLLAVMGEVESETTAWAAEYKSNLAELEKTARQQLETNKPGTINLTVKNAGAVTGGVTVLLDEVARQTITTNECQLSPVFPGDHFVKIVATIGGKSVTAGAPVRMASGQSVPLILSLPSS